MRSRPFTLFLVILALITLIILGFWQVIRLGEKNSVLTEIKNNFSHEAQELPPEFLNSSVVKTYTKYRLYGRFELDKNILLYSSNSRHPEKHGYFILTPFKLNNGHSVLINRGWVPQSKSKPPPPALDKEYAIDVLALRPKAPGIFTPHNDKKNNVWLYVDLKSMGEYTNTPIDQEFYMVMLRGSPSQQDIILMPAESFLNVRNDHLWYALTWFGLALALAVIYWLSVKRNGGA